MSLDRYVPAVMLGLAAGGGAISHFTGGYWLNGALVGFAVAFAPLAVLCILYCFMQVWRPDRPRCACGLDSYEFVQIVKPDEHDANSWQYEYRCTCGLRYLAVGSRFDLLDDSGRRVPYMCHSAWSRWRPAGG